MLQNMVHPQIHRDIYMENVIEMKPPNFLHWLLPITENCTKEHKSLVIPLASSPVLSLASKSSLPHLGEEQISECVLVLLDMNW